MTNRTEVNMEFVFACSPAMLYSFLTTSEGLKSWFCDDVVIADSTYVFSWDQETESAQFVAEHNTLNIQFDWTGREVQESTRLEIVQSPLTRETILHVKTICESNYTEEEEIYWQNIIRELKRATGG